MSYFDVADDTLPAETDEERRRKVLGLIASAPAKPVLAERPPTAAPPMLGSSVQDVEKLIGRPADPAKPESAYERYVRKVGTAPFSQEEFTKTHPDLPAWKKLLGGGLATIAGGLSHRPELASELAYPLLHRPEIQYKQYLGQRQQDIGEAQKAAQMELQQTEEQRKLAESEAKEPRQVAPEAQTFQDLIKQGKTSQEALEIIKSAGKADPQAKTPSDAAYAVTKMMHPELKEGTPEFAKAWEGLRMKERTDPGIARMAELLQRGYTPVNDAQGRTVGWANPITGHFRPIGDIRGASEAAAGVPGAPMPVKPGQQATSRAVAAHSMLPLIARVRELLADPEVRQTVGVLPGRVSEAEKRIGNAPRKTQELYGTLKSIYSLGGTMHGWRALEVAQEFEKAYGGLHTNPDSLLGGLDAMEATARSVGGEIGRGEVVPGAQKTTPSGKWNSRTGRYE